MRILELKVPPVAMFLLFGVAMWGIAVTFPAAAFPLPGARIIAVALAGLGGAIGLAGVSAFRRHSTTVDPMTPARASAIVSNGIYRYSRNPMYVGLLLGLAGWAAFLANAAALVMLPLFVAYMTRFQIKPEECALLANFGSGYAEYMAAVRRWI